MERSCASAAPWATIKANATRAVRSIEPVYRKRNGGESVIRTRDTRIMIPLL
jgi:hypothetical protein